MKTLAWAAFAASLIFIAGLMFSPAIAATYNVPASPGAVQALINGGKLVAGDVILMADGDHGGLDLRAPAFALTIKAAHPNHKNRAHVDFIYVRTGNPTIAGLNVWPTDPGVHGADLVGSAAGTVVTFRGLDVRAGKDAASFLGWSAQEWIRRSANGVNIGGTGSVVNSVFTGVHFGIILAPNSSAIGNTVNGFSGDGMRGGSGDVFRGNTVQNAVSVDDNHADGFQAGQWDASGLPAITGLVLDGNTIIEWNLPPNPLRAGMQGIGLFDGFYDNLTITGNTIITDIGHGIAVYGGRGVTITGNTVVAISGQAAAKWPWIGVFPHKNGTPSTGVTATGNFATAFAGIPLAGNTVITDPAAMLAKYGVAASSFP